MRTVAVAIEDDAGLDSKVSPHFGDGSFYLLAHVDEQGIRQSEVRPAPAATCSKWSCRAHRSLTDLGCDAILSPRFGRRGKAALANAGVEAAGAAGTTAREVIETYLREGPKAHGINTLCPHSKRGMMTAAAHAGGMDAATGSVMPPIYQTSTFAFANAVEGADRFSGKEEGYIYTRMGNPTIRALEDTVAALEGGYAGLATASGMAAVVTVFMTFLGKDLHLVSTDSVYGPSRVVVEKDLSRFGVEYDFVDTADVEAVRAAMRPNTKLIYVETPANPTIKLTDIAACAELAHEHGALLVVDNTFMSPYLQRPFELGADIVLHSMTKFLNGHSDVVAGMLVSRNEELHKQLYRVLIYLGGTMDPHQAYLVVRGIKTLGLRVERSQQNAEQLAPFLEQHPKVEWVRYPGLESHPQHELASRQMRGPGALISFGVTGGLEAGRKLMDTVKVPTLAVSLGGVESLIQHPASMTHASMAPEAREAAGITDGLIRLSVGCEDLEDIVEDLEQALAQI